MNSTRIFLFTLVVLAIPSSLFAGFVTPVTHSEIFKVAVERNVVTFFMTTEAEQPPLRTSDIGSPIEIITLEHQDHDHVPHYGHGIDGVYLPHIHVAFVTLGVVPPDLLNRLLLAMQFPDEERIRVMTEYARYFQENTGRLRAERPLRPGPRLVPTTNALVPPQTQRLSEGMTWREPSILETNFALFVVLLSIIYPAAASF